MDLEKRKLPVTILIRSLTVFALLLFVGFWAVSLDSRNYIEARKHSTLQLSGALASTLSQLLNSSISLTYTLEALLIDRQFDIDQKILEKFAAPLLKQQPTVSNLQYAPAGIVSYIYPLEGNEAAIGHNLLDDQKRNKEAFDAVEKHLLTVAGPFELIQGEVALVARLPIFRTIKEQEAFWGFSTVLIKVRDLMEDSAITKLSVQGYEWNLYRIHPDTNLPHVFYGTTTELIDDAIQLEIRTPNSIWYLNIKPNAGWLFGHKLHIAILITFSLLFSLGFTYFIYYFQKQPILLKKQVELKTAALQKAQNELAQHHNQLEILVEEKTRKLKNAQDELLQRERLTTLGQLTATVSHELRNPLGTIQTALFVIKDSLKSNDPENMEKSIKLAERNIDRCVNIIDELNSYTRIKQLNISCTNVDEWLQNIVDEQNIPKEILCEWDFSSRVDANIDRERLRQAVVNIISNAVHALQEKQSEGRLLRATTSNLGDKVEIHFSDNGVGMSEDTIEKIFTPLFSTKRFGVGLGMVVVKNIIEQHQGEIIIESDEGFGTSIRLLLPINLSL